MAYRRNEGAVIYILTSAQVRGDDYRRALGAEHLRRVEIMQTRKFFRDLGPFKHWRPESFMQLADKATRRHIPAHAVVARRGASCDTVAFVVQGELKLEGAVAIGTQRKSVDLLRLGPGSMLGDVMPARLAMACGRRDCRRYLIIVACGFRIQHLAFPFYFYNLILFCQKSPN